MKKLLEKLGLEDKEQVVYLECLKRESTTPSELVKNIGFKRSTVYFYLEKLRAKGLVSSKIVKRAKRIVATAAKEALENLVEQQKKHATEAQHAFEKLIPELEQRMKSNQVKDDNKSSVYYYLGSEGTRQLGKKVLREKKDIYWFGSMEFILSIVPAEKLYRSLTLKRMTWGTTSYAITDKRILKSKRFSEKLGDFRKFRFLEKNFDIPALLIIFGNNIAIVTRETNNNRGIKTVLIEDALMSKLVLSLFTTLWNKL